MKTTDQPVMTFAWPGRLEAKPKRIDRKTRYLQAIGADCSPTTNFPAVGSETNKTLTKLSVYTGPVPGGTTRRDVFDEPQKELTFIDEDRNFRTHARGCPNHGTEPVLQRRCDNGKILYRTRCVFVDCAYTGEWHKTRQKAFRLWNLQVLLTR